MHYPAIKYYYDQLKADSFEADVDRVWNNILPLYFTLAKNYGIEQVQQPYPGVAKTESDFIIRYIRNGQQKKVALLEDKRVSHESASAAWAAAVNQLTDYLKVARAEAQYSDGKPCETVYAVVTIGHYSRFYEFPFDAQELQDYGTTGGRVFEFKNDEDDIDMILLDMVQKTSH